MTPDEDPFGRKEEERTDPFGRPLDEQGESAPSSGSLWSGPAESASPQAPSPSPSSPSSPPSGPPRFIPPTDDPPRRDFAPPVPRSDAAGQAGVATGELAGYGERVGAAVVDFFVRAAIMIAVTLIVAAAAGGNDDAVTAALLISVYLIAPLYAPLAMSRWDGQTVGHRAVNTRIVTRKGTPVTGGKAFVREFLTKGVLVEGIGGLFTLGILPLVNYLWPLWDERNEALHDKMCDTRVVKT